MAGTLFIVTAPSGAGKTTMVRGLLQRDPRVQLSISYTTRAPRPGEQDGREYNFVDVPTFRALRDRGEFLEWAEVHGNYYATSRVWLKQQVDAGRESAIDDYAAESPEEFFAVCTEYHFSDPRRLRAAMPEVAAHLQRFYGMPLLV